jgi:hypothetical protein
MRDKNRRAIAAFFRILVANDRAGCIVDEILRRDPSAVVDIRLARPEDARTFTAEQRSEARDFFASRVAYRASISIEYDRNIGDPAALIAVPAIAPRRRRRRAA